MIRLIVSKTSSAVLTLVVASSIAFFLARGSGSPVQQILGDFATPDQIAQLNAELGMDQPLIVQYGRFLLDLATFNLGDSLRYDLSNVDLIASRLPASIGLAVAALLIAVLIGVPLGILAAVREGGIIDRLASAMALLGQSVPLFWLGLMLIMLFAVQLGWLPAGQNASLPSLVLPAVTLSTLPMAQIARLTRSSMSEVLQEGFVSAARARGLAGWRIILVHALRSAALPVVTIVGLQMGMLFSGAVTVEFVFAWPGLGSLATQAVQTRDFPLVQAIVIVGALGFVLINLLVDLLYGLVDPRIRESA
ncbi:peptide/nickel transport system permease protein [Arthrobacter ginsengisoli]|uniref:Peptide/nickel transport system permease protein n=1 Tax=Arthrobacter ginsengisoli TaxID=1356565 RepID=A0ABU1UI17_9MICC|nr:ABC transporter permease [Arthrobacter ginsengisoli]MDR7084841.1 peptide/nickel transport system permease protein [Arthrobacter ginsengisoli]